MKARKRDKRLKDVIAEMRHRASDGCNGEQEGICSEVETDLHPEDWCNHCLMGLVVQASEEQEQP